MNKNRSEFVWNFAVSLIVFENYYYTAVLLKKTLMSRWLKTSSEQPWTSSINENIKSLNEMVKGYITDNEKWISDFEMQINQQSPRGKIMNRK